MSCMRCSCTWGWAWRILGEVHVDWCDEFQLGLQLHLGLSSCRSWASPGPSAVAELEQHSSSRLGCSETYSPADKDKGTIDWEE